MDQLDDCSILVEVMGVWSWMVIKKKNFKELI